MNSDNKMIPTDRFLRSGMSKDAKLTVILRCTGIWIRGSKFGTSWKAVRILVHPLNQKPMFKFLTPSPPKEDDRPSPPTEFWTDMDNEAAGTNFRTVDFGGN